MRKMFLKSNKDLFKRWKVQGKYDKPIQVKSAVERGRRAEKQRDRLLIERDELQRQVKVMQSKTTEWDKWEEKYCTDIYHL